MNSCITGKTMEANKSFATVSSRVKHQPFKQLPVIVQNQYSWMNQERSRCPINLHTKHGVRLVPWRGVINTTPRLMDSPDLPHTMSQNWLTVSQRGRSQVDVRDRTYHHHGQPAWTSANSLDKRVGSELDKRIVMERNKIKVSHFPRLSVYNSRRSNGPRPGLVKSPRLRFQTRDENDKYKVAAIPESQLPFRVMKIDPDVSVINGHEYRSASTDIEQRITFPVLSADGRRVIVRRVTRPLQYEEHAPYRSTYHTTLPYSGSPRLMPLEPKRHSSVEAYLEYVDTLPTKREMGSTYLKNDDDSVEKSHTRLLESVMEMNRPVSELDIDDVVD